MGASRYTPEQHGWIAENFESMTNAELAEAFSERFGEPCTAARMRAYGSNHGLRKAEGVRARAVKAGHGAPWTPEADEWFRSFVPGHTEREISAEFERLFGFPLTADQIGSRKTTLGVKSGTHGGRFEKGHVPANKGKTWDEMGIGPEAQARSRATCFKKGDEPHTGERFPIGSERVNKDGYLQVKVRTHSDRPCTNKCWRMKHHLVWEEANGRPVPEHTMIVFADGDKTNLDPGNLVAVPRGIWAVISHSSIPYCDRPSLEAAMAVAALDRARAAAERHPRACRRCGAEFAPRFPAQRTCDACLGRAGQKKPPRHREGPDRL